MNDFGMIFSTHRRAIIITASASLVGLLALLFLMNNAIVFITTNSSNWNVKYQVIKNGEVKDITGGAITIVPRGSDTLLATSGDTVATSSSLSLPWYGITAKTIELKPSKNANKVAFVSPSGICTAYNSSLDKLLRYDCEAPQVLYEYQTPEDAIWGDRELKELSYIENQSLPPYMNGVIGIAVSSEASHDGADTHQHSAHVDIKATSPNEVKSYEAPTGLDSEVLAGLRVYTDASSTTNSRFVLVDKFGSIHLGLPADQGNEVNYKFAEAPDTYNPTYNTTKCSLTGDKVFCYRGRNTEVIAGGNTALTKPKIEEYSFKDGLVSSKDIGITNPVDVLYLAGSDLYIAGDDTLYRLALKDGKYSVKPIVKDIDSAATDGTSIYFARDNKAYTYNAKTDSTHLLFKSPNVQAVGLYPVDGKLFLFGTTKDSESVVFAYQINDTDYNGDKRLVDILPLAENTSNEIYANDFVGNKLFLQLYGDSVSDDEVRQLFIDEVAKQGLGLKPEDIQANR